MRRAVGFLWTLPVPWAGFSKLPDDLDAASAASMTIRYQRAILAHHSSTWGYTLVHHEVFMEVRPDRGTEVIVGALAKAEAICRLQDAILLIVDFAEVHGWRSHPWIDGWTRETSIEVETVPPYAIPIDGHLFDPHDHFIRWREQQAAWMAGKADRVSRAMEQATTLRRDGLSHARIADRLNRERIPSATGKPWTGENVRKFLGIGDKAN